MDAMANTRKLIKNMAQQIYEDEVKKCCCKSLTWAGGEILMIFGKNVKEIFRFYE
jgi:hypothetical protein